MNQYLIEAFTSTHDGRTRRFYVLSENVVDAVTDFSLRNPKAVVRNVWQFVPTSYYAQPSTADGLQEDQ